VVSLENIDKNSKTYFDLIVSDIKNQLSDGHCKTIILGSRFMDIQNSDQIKKVWCEKKGRPCKNLYEFCEQEFHLKKTSVKTYIAVTKRFGVYGLDLKEEFKLFNFTQLTEMLPLSDEQLKLVTVDMTVAEIRALKKANIKNGQLTDQYQSEPSLDVLKCQFGLTNDKQRLEFVRLYKTWDLWFEIPQFEQKIYRAMLNNGDYLIVTEQHSFERVRDCPPSHFLSIYKKGTSPTLYGYNHYGNSDNEYLSYMRLHKPKIIASFECASLEEYKNKLKVEE